MCGRFTLRITPAEIQEVFDLIREPEWSPRYNVAPTQNVLAVRAEDEGRAPALLRWGLIPSWAKDEGIGARMINARSETVDEKPSYRSAFKKRRCLILADGFYEWQRTGTRKQPYHITLKNGRPFAFAGLWEKWQDVESCTILTTIPNTVTAKIHDRMPVILAEDDHDVWLDPAYTTREELENLFDPYPAKEMQATPVSTIVNNPRNDKPECVVAVEV